ncbi:hypothetical protein [Azospirillum rugosum]|uniref:hypothetical protein n=1 Tax=Azospirillum rugosum TaxID=416170 RepID=UPI003A9481C5
MRFFAHLHQPRLAGTSTNSRFTAPGTEAHAREGMFLVAPNGREEEVRAQLARPAFSRVADLKVRYLPYGELESHRESIARFGTGMKAIHAISRTLV